MKRKKHRGMSTIRRPMGVDRVRRSNVWSMWRYIILIAAAAAGVLLMIFFGFPLIEDLIKGVIRRSVTSLR